MHSLNIDRFLTQRDDFGRGIVPIATLIKTKICHITQIDKH